MTLSAGARFRSAMKQKNDNNQPLQIAGAINAYTAMMATQVGHQALYLSGAGVANASFGLPDLGMTSLDNVLEDARRITDAVDTPLLVDIDSQQELKQRLIDAFKNPTVPKLTHRKIPRQLRHFDVATTINFEFNEASNQHIMSLETLDQPGLLARVGQVFLQQKIEVHAARITTLGERAEDMFYISDQDDLALSADKLETLKATLIESLSIRNEA